MATTALATIEELGELPPPTPARPRVLLLATSLATGAVILYFAALLGVYLHERAAVLRNGDPWFPEDVTIPLTPGNMSLIGFAISCVTILWAVDAIAHDDRRHTWLAFGSTLVVGAFHLVGMSYLYSQMGFEVATFQGALVYAVTGSQLVMTGVAMLFVALMAFRTLGGQYSARDQEGVVAAAVFWIATAVVYFAVWLAVLVMK
jgi:heme/copper-type cytochrome/quinol oxidase subunit 3